MHFPQQFAPQTHDYYAPKPHTPESESRPAEPISAKYKRLKNWKTVLVLTYGCNEEPAGTTLLLIRVAIRFVS